MACQLLPSNEGAVGGSAGVGVAVMSFAIIPFQLEPLADHGNGRQWRLDARGDKDLGLGTGKRDS
jgi:hypothetical protein